MKAEQKQAQKAAESAGKIAEKEVEEDFKQAAKNVVKGSMMPKDLLGLSDSMIEGIYGQAYRLYNTGKFKEASQLFRLLVMINSVEAKFVMGLAACMHMMKEYKAAAEAYMLCAVIDGMTPIPHFHASDCYLQMDDKPSAIISLEMAIKRCKDTPEFRTLKDRAALTLKKLQEEVRSQM
jgi:type III secretion system low calcium response chaperone LcrH/SycD